MEYKIVIPEMFGWTQTPEKIEQMPVNQPYLLNDGTVMLVSEDGDYYRCYFDDCEDVWVAYEQSVYVLPNSKVFSKVNKFDYIRRPQPKTFGDCKEGYIFQKKDTKELIVMLKFRKDEGSTMGKFTYCMYTAHETGFISSKVDFDWADKEIPGNWLIMGEVNLQKSHSVKLERQY